MGKVIGAKREKLCGLSNLIGVVVAGVVGIGFVVDGVVGDVVAGVVVAGVVVPVFLYSIQSGRNVSFASSAI